MIEDIVCNSTLSEDNATYSSQYHGRVYDFCSLRCKRRFELSPEEFIAFDDTLEFTKSILLAAVA
jgi:YHS domain-containing protein